MTLLNVERIKLFSTRSPYWCVALILIIGVGVSILFGATASDSSITLSNSQFWANLGMMVAMVMAALAITTEYRFGTIRNSVLAVPKRGSVLAAKTIVVALISAVMGLITSIIAYYLVLTIGGNHNGQMDISTSGDWRVLLGNTVIFALAAVIAVAVGTLVRQSAGAIAILLLWPLLVESIIGAFGKTGRNISEWLPFSAGSRFTQAANPQIEGEDLVSTSAPNWWQGLVVFALTALVLWIIALVVLKRRDA
ncbi:hypothetical protein D1871_23385 [Nakamurella silvestris]|nr:hypothetical protein D1871_23385 [Nakamurella silvestris]